MGIGVIYVATNTANGKQYVGLTRLGVATRWAQHCTNSRRPKTHFHRAISKYGPNAFYVEEYASALSMDVLAQLEKDVILQLAPAYNQTCGGEITRGRKYDDAAKERIRLSNIGRKLNDEQRKRISDAKKRYFAENPDRRKQMIAKLHAVRHLGESLRLERVTSSAKNRIWSDESRAKLSASRLGIKHTPDVLARIAESNRKKIVCKTTGVVYSCRTEAAKFCGVSERSILRVCGGQYPSVKGLEFSYLE